MDCFSPGYSHLFCFVPKSKCALKLYNTIWDLLGFVLRANPKWLSAFLMDKVHPCVKFNKSSALPLLCFSFGTCIHRPLILHSSSPFSNANGPEPCWSSWAWSWLSSLKRVYRWSRRVFIILLSRQQEVFIVVHSSWPQSQQLTAMHHGCPTIVTMYNETKSIISAHSVLPPTTVCPGFALILPGFFILRHRLVSKVFETVWIELFPWAL